MGERRYKLLLSISLLLVACSITLAVIGYRLYISGKEKKQVSVTATAQPVSAPPATRDSLQAMYASVITNIDDNLSRTLTSTDSLKTDISTKLNDLNNLKAEIALLLKDKTPNADLDLARQKIVELQIKVNQLTNRTINVEEENRKLLALLQQLKNSASPQAATVSNNTKQPLANTTTADDHAPLTATEMHLLAVATNNDKEQETTQADNTEKMIGSFTLKGAAQIKDADIMVVVLQPDGKVLKNSPWESGMFDTKEGKKIYSRKMHIDGNDRQLNFSLRSESYQKGNYTMQVYYNGQLIGKTARSLS